MKKASVCGFELTDGEFDVIETRLLRFRRARKESFVEINTAVFEGRLKVTDSELFNHALTQGIGRAKAYGCGLLTVMVSK
jgi:CRISPR system Cascade subunit CasE